MQTEDNKLRIKLQDIVLNKKPELSDSISYIYTINNIEASPKNGEFLLLGGICTSVVDFMDGSDSLLQPSNSHELVLFDGCYPCNTCSTIAQLQEDIQNCQIWLNGLKDCNLYHQTAASRLWQAMLNKKVQQSVSCRLDSSIVAERQHDFGMATKLLYQYKAAVAMWNYLVRTKSGMTEISIAPQDYAGFVVQSKRNIDSCGKASAGSPTFQISVTLQVGQTASYLAALQCGMGFYISKAEENTYIEYGRDTGITRQQDVNNIQMTITSVQYAQQQIQLKIGFTFYPQKCASSIFSAAVKILPVVYKLGYEYPVYDEKGEVQQSYPAPYDSPVQIDLDEWIAWRSKATTVTEAMQKARNRWFIQTIWTTDMEEAPIEQSFYYHTAYSKYTEVEEQPTT